MPADARRSQSSVIVGTSARSLRLSVTVTVSTADDQLFVPTRERLKAAVGQTEAEEPLEVLRHIDLESAVTRQDVQPAAEVAFALDDLTQALPAIRHEHPTTVEIGREQPGDAVRPPRGEQGHDGGLVRQQRDVGLEPDVSTRGRHPQHCRPRSDVRLFDGTGRLKADLFELSIEPGLDTREPACIRPDVHRPSVLLVPCASVRECPLRVGSGACEPAQALERLRSSSSRSPCARSRRQR